MNSPTDFSRLVDAEHIAKVFGVAVSTVLLWRRQGRIQGIKVTPHTIRFDLEQVMAALAKGSK